jgi:catechol 2,3-dioxygenase-like lactoylglutathione lyase family enzyme
MALLSSACGDDSEKEPAEKGGAGEGDTGRGSQRRDAATPARSDAAMDARTPAADASSSAPVPTACAQRPVDGDPVMRFHHVHFNTADPDADLAFFETFFGALPIEFCRDESSGAVTRATKTERGYFLYTQVETAPDPALNTYLEHVGWIHPSPNEELLRLVELGAPLYPEGRAQCPEAFAGQMACGMGGYWFYLQAPSGARIEVARGPGPAASGFGHVHMIMGVDLTWYATVTDGAYASGAIDMVNHTSVALQESILADEMVVETRGKPIDHLGYSTTDLEGAKARILAAGIAIEEDISFQPQYGFRSFFVKDAKGIWVEIVEDSPFAP